VKLLLERRECEVTVNRTDVTYVKMRNFCNILVHNIREKYFLRNVGVSILGIA